MIILLREMAYFGSSFDTLQSMISDRPKENEGGEYVLKRKSLILCPGVQTNKQTRRVFFPPKSATDLKISYGYPFSNGLGSRLSFPPFPPQSPAFKIKYTLLSHQSSSRLQESDLLRVTQRNSWQRWTMSRGSAEDSESWGNARCHTASLLPPHLICPSLCTNIPP